MRIFTFLFLLGCFPSLAQEAVDSISIDSIDVKPIVQKKNVEPILKIDSVSLNYFTLDDVYLKRVITDTLLDHIQNYNPINNRRSPYANLGNMGSAHTSLLYIPNKQIGFRIGKPIYNLYLRDNKDLKFYNSNRPLTQLFYSQGRGQNNTQFQGAFAKNFTRGIHFSIDYQKVIHQLSSEIAINQNAIYPTQVASLSSLITGFWYQSKTNRYNAFLSFKSNYVEQRFHGGVDWNSDLAAQIDTAANLNFSFSIPILANKSPKYRQSSKKVALQQNYQLSSLFNDNALVVSHEIGYEVIQQKFYDVSPDSNYYKQFFTDKRGIRSLIKDNVFSNEVNLKWINHKNQNGSKELFSAGLVYNFHHILQEPDTNNINDIFAIGKINIPIAKFGLLNANAKLGLGNSTGDFSLDGQLKVKFKKIGDVQLAGYFTRFQPSLLQSKLNISSVNYWNNDFKRIINFGLQGQYFLKNYNLEIGIKSHTINNYIYFNQNQKYQQADNLLAVIQIYTQKDFHLNVFHLKNRITFQKSGDLIRLPDLLLNHSFFIQTKLFEKRMLTKIGVDLQWVQNYKGNKFNFLVGDFYLQDDIQISAYPLMNVFLDVKVQNFRAFLKVENIYAPFTNDVYYQVPYYLKREMDFRFGIHWDFWDKKRQKINQTNSTKPKTQSRKPNGL